MVHRLASVPRRGTSAMIVIFLFAALMTISYFIINVSLIQRHHASAQMSADLASRYGVEAISRLERVNARDLEDIREEVTRAAQDNWLLTTDSSSSRRQRRQDVDVEVQFGNASVADGKPVFNENARPINSVRVAVGKDITLWTLNDEQDVNVGVSRDATSAALERDICLVLDRSGSINFDLRTGDWMYDYSQHPYNALSNSSSSYYRSISYAWWWYWPHPTRSRWSTMIPALYGLVDELEDTNQEEQLSLVSYSSSSTINFYDHRPGSRRYRVYESELESRPTFDYQDAVETFDNRYRFQQPVAGGTNISAGIDEATAVLISQAARPYAFKTMIVMTDGQYNEGRAPWLAAADAADEGIQVHTVTFSDQADQRSMERTAEAGNGSHFHAPDGDALEQIFREIAKMPAAAIIE